MCEQQKQQENEQALKLLSTRLADMDKMSLDEQCLAVVKGVLGGNVFDWGAKDVAALMESTQFGFNQALSKLQGTLRRFCSFLLLIFYYLCNIEFSHYPVFEPLLLISVSV